MERPRDAPLVGRTEERTLLRETLARVLREREPQLVTLVGVPGIGKSRLVAELLEEERGDERALSLQGHSLPYGEGVTFWALGEMVKGHAGILESDTADETAEKLSRVVTDVIAEPADAARVERHLRPLAGLETEDIGAGDRRSEAFAAWRRFLEALAERRPLVLVFEDLHWADDDLLDFVDHLLDWATGVPILVLVTARPELLVRRPDLGRRHGQLLDHPAVCALRHRDEVAPRRAARALGAIGGGAQNAARARRRKPAVRPGVRAHAERPARGS